MRIYISHSREFDYKKELYEPIKNSNLFNQHKFIFPHDDSEKPNDVKYMLQTHEIELIIAEISFPSTGQGIELGLANSFSVPIECIYKKNKKYSNSIGTITSHFIEYSSNIIEVIEKILRDYGI